MHVVVRVAPLVTRTSGVPFEALGVETWILHPVVLAVHHVVADLHVVEDLGQRERGHAAEPCRRQEAGEQQPPAAQLERTLGLDDPADVVGVALAEICKDAIAKRVELPAELLDLLFAQLWMGSGHRDLVPLFRFQISSATSPAGTDTQSWISSSSSAETSPVRTVRTSPAVL